MTTPITANGTTNGIPDTLMRSAVQPEKDTTRTDFLQLLVAQIEHQDPLQPQDGTEFMQQLATLTQVEQAAASNTKLQELIDVQLGSQRTGMIGMVGQNAMASADKIHLPPQAGVDVMVRMPKNTTDAVLQVKDSNDKVIKEIKLTDLQAGDHAISAEDLKISPGDYKLEVKGTVGGAKDIAIPTAVRGQVDKLEMADGVLKFYIGGTMVLPQNILSVGA